MTTYSTSRDYARLKQVLDAGQEILASIGPRQVFLRRLAPLTYRAECFKTDGQSHPARNIIGRATYTLEDDALFAEFCAEENISYPFPFITPNP